MAKKKTSKSKSSNNPKDWVKKPGSFTAYCKKKGYKGVTQACIEEGKRSSNPKTRKRATLAKTFKKWAAQRKKKK